MLDVCQRLQSAVSQYGSEKGKKKKKRKQQTEYDFGQFKTNTKPAFHPFSGSHTLGYGQKGMKRMKKKGGEEKTCKII